MIGKDFDRGLIKLVDEFENLIFLDSFQAQCAANSIEVPEIYININNVDDENQEYVDQAAAQVYEQLQPLIAQFREMGREYPNFQFWDDYLQNVSLPIMLFLASIKSGDWLVNQAAKKAFVNRDFVGRLGEGKFNNVWMNYMLEMT